VSANETRLKEDDREEKNTKKDHLERFGKIFKILVRSYLFHTCCV
jgi:hypothetical protein